MSPETACTSRIAGAAFWRHAQRAAALGTRLLAWVVVAWLGISSPVAMAKPAATKPVVLCHYTYGGEDFLLTVPSTDNPYEVKPVQVGSYFLLKVVFQDKPKDLASVKIYVYADEDPIFKPIQHATYTFRQGKKEVMGGKAARATGGPNDFTGLQRVYESHRDGELEYWCEMSSKAAR